MEFRAHKDTDNNKTTNFRLHKSDDTPKPTRYYSKKQEDSVANATGGKTTANSGATPYQKGDVVDNDWMLECKTTMKDQQTFTMREEWFKKNISESIFMKKAHTAVVFNFGPDKPNYYVIDEKTFLRMKELLDMYGDEE